MKKKDYSELNFQPVYGYKPPKGEQIEAVPVYGFFVPEEKPEMTIVYGYFMPEEPNLNIEKNNLYTITTNSLFMGEINTNSKTSLTLKETKE